MSHSHGLVDNKPLHYVSYKAFGR